MKSNNTTTTMRSSGRYGRNNDRRNFGSMRQQRGMGATIILFTIALIVLVGAALAYASRGNPNSMTVQSARVYSGLLLKQSGDFRDAYSRYIFDGGVASAMTFNSGATAAELFLPTNQYGNYQAPPAQAMNGAATPQWLYTKTAAITGIGTAAADSIAYVPDVLLAVCTEVNRQLYGTAAVDPAASGVANLAAIASAVSIGVTSGRSSGCFATTDTKYVVYVTLGEA